MGFLFKKNSEHDWNIQLTFRRIDFFDLVLKCFEIDIVVPILHVLADVLLKQH